MSGESQSHWHGRIVVGIVVAVAISCAAAAYGAQASRAVSASDNLGTTPAAPSNGSIDSSNSKENYIIGSGDMLSVNVYNEPEVTGKVPVRPDGMITIPLIGEVQASGQTPDKLQATIAKKLADYVRQPSVTVVVEEMNSRQFNVLGQVQHPGTFNLNRPTRVLDALAEAGGFTEFAKSAKIYVLRRDSSGSATKIAFNYKRVSEGKSDQDDVELQPGDTVIVP
jgi:polysaccharide biosynthesis/export protein